MWIYGSSLYATLIAVVVPDAEVVTPWLKEKGIAGDFAEAAKSQKLKDAILEDIIAIAKQEAIPGFKVPKDVIIEVGFPPSKLSSAPSPLGLRMTIQPHLIRHVAPYHYSKQTIMPHRTTECHQRPRSRVYH